MSDSTERYESQNSDSLIETLSRQHDEAKQILCVVLGYPGCSGDQRVFAGNYTIVTLATEAVELLRLQEMKLRNLKKENEKLLGQRTGVTSTPD